MEETKAKQYWCMIHAHEHGVGYYEDDEGREIATYQATRPQTYFFTSDKPEEIDQIEEDFISSCDDTYNADITAESKSMGRWREVKKYEQQQIADAEAFEKAMQVQFEQEKLMLISNHEQIDEAIQKESHAEDCMIPFKDRVN
jgi:hypothetical protein